MHIRRKIIEDVKDNLSKSSFFSNVWIQRAIPQRASYPCITIFPEQENVETMTIHSPNRPQDRDLILNITAWLKGSPDDEKILADIDDASENIEKLITIADLADDIQLIATEFNIDDDEPEISAVSLLYQIQYTTTEKTPSV